MFILKEGDKWDERNLYTILTYSQSRTFTFKILFHS